MLFFSFQPSICAVCAGCADIVLNVLNVQGSSNCLENFENSKEVSSIEDSSKISSNLNTPAQNTQNALEKTHIAQNTQRHVHGVANNDR